MINRKNMDINKYFEENRVTEIKTGQSGAEVYEINDDSILKHIVRSKLPEEKFSTYSREALFYQSKMNTPAGYLPEVLNIEISDSEIILLIKKYRTLERKNLDDNLLHKIMKALAAVHLDTIPDFLSDKNEPAVLSEDKIAYCLNGWHKVLSEHPGAFNEKPLDSIAGKINDIIKWHGTEQRSLVHGDFHWENLLEDSAGNIIVCDWQGVRVGGASDDLSFFISRLGDDGFNVDSEVILKAYAAEMKKVTGEEIDIQNIQKHIAATNVITSFEFWHEFLHGTNKERVAGIYDRMISDFSLV